MKKTLTVIFTLTLIISIFLMTYVDANAATTPPNVNKDQLEDKFQELKKDRNSIFI